ncbi:MAG: N-acetylmuramoyl-L-alanine amidase [Microscillaceae bacterium]|nr:N-acetylmuramoyl-L-alanine amidase [Microscillaceae bacterium]MDW8460897.1 hypothetical protein [Cytophagales bacterium]
MAGSHVQKIEKYRKKLQYYLQKDSLVASFIQIDAQGISLFDSEQAKQKRQAEFQLSWEKLDDFQRLIRHCPDQAWQIYDTNNWQLLSSFQDTLAVLTSQLALPRKRQLPLAGIRIALDAGHFASNLNEAKIEERFIQMRLPKEKQVVTFFEAHLTWCTAQILKEKLEKQGAIVLLTRPTLEANAKQMWQSWREAKAQLKKNNLIDTLQAFHTWLINYKKQDLITRYQKINNFKPNLTLIIHYNVDADNTCRETPTPKNYNMAFVAGSFLGKELNTKKDRFHLLRLLVSQEIENSIAFAEKVLQSFEKHLQVPTIPAETQLDYLKKNCLLTERQGVYARNLTLCREVLGTLCYGESLYQDNQEEALALSKRELEILPNIFTSKRVAQVAEAYYEAILEYIKETNKKKLNF